jgi:hypothetical protein
MDDIRQKDISNIYLIRNDLSKLDKTYADRYAYADQEKKRKFIFFFRKKK